MLDKNYFMNKSEFYRICAKKCGSNEKQISTVLAGVRCALVEVLNLGEDVNINGVGKFYVKVKPPRTITNNLSGKEVLVDQKFSVAFRGSKKLAKEIG